jgi:hypothetical protein
MIENFVEDLQYERVSEECALILAGLRTEIGDIGGEE